MNLKEAADKYRKTGLKNRDLIEYAQKLVNRQMKCSAENPPDRPDVVFKKGRKTGEPIV